MRLIVAGIVVMVLATCDAVAAEPKEPASVWTTPVAEAPRTPPTGPLGLSWGMSEQQVLTTVKRGQCGMPNVTSAARTVECELESKGTELRGRFVFVNDSLRAVTLNLPDSNISEASEHLIRLTAAYGPPTATMTAALNTILTTATWPERNVKLETGFRAGGLVMMSLTYDSPPPSEPTPALAVVASTATPRVDALLPLAVPGGTYAVTTPEWAKARDIVLAWCDARKGDPMCAEADFREAMAHPNRGDGWCLSDLRVDPKYGYLVAATKDCGSFHVDLARAPALPSYVVKRIWYDGGGE